MDNIFVVKNFNELDGFVHHDCTIVFNRFSSMSSVSRKSRGVFSLKENLVKDLVAQLKLFWEEYDVQHFSNKVNSGKCFSSLKDSFSLGKL